VNRNIECEQCGLNHPAGLELEALLKAVDRYQWLRQNPAFESESVLSGLGPAEFDQLVDARRCE